MLEGKAMVEDTDMPLKMQLQAMSSASEALDLFDVFDCRSIAAHIKKVGNVWLAQVLAATSPTQRGPSSTSAWSLSSSSSSKELQRREQIQKYCPGGFLHIKEYN